MHILEAQTRAFVPLDQFRSTVAHYKALVGGRCTLHFPFPARGMELAAVSSAAGSFLILDGSEQGLARARQTQLTMLVEDIGAVPAAVAALGAELLQTATPVPTGFQARARHPGGLVVEYVQHTAAANPFRNCCL